MDTILVKVSDLLAKVQELAHDNVESVELCLLEADGELPACVSFNAVSPIYDCYIDYGEVNVADTDC